MVIDYTVVGRLRSIYRLSLADMAALLGVSESHLCRVEKGERVMNDGMRQRCINELELSPEKLNRLLSLYDETEVDHHKLRDNHHKRRG
ncbi:helix-turn-helix domain-containing protein [Paenibacillus polymyxa]|uniref:helix-turn-helix domain-containing protein n=1 Tax=Paenibacillus polymyxa TaxID=1406 RepID=UPI000845CF59|nr:helix-turn-helix transcriptional regulator [Paenibacillus polymyxa]AOK88965.1 hypothetical protein AOU00_03575 [Paenibacillus polymyxa]